MLLLFFIKTSIFVPQKLWHMIIPKLKIQISPFKSVPCCRNWTSSSSWIASAVHAICIFYFILFLLGRTFKATPVWWIMLHGDFVDFTWLLVLFSAIFETVSEQWGNVDVGVMVCGPPSLQSCVAKECRSQNIRGRWNHPIFHFNSHSFDLWCQISCMTHFEVAVLMGPFKRVVMPRL